MAENGHCASLKKIDTLQTFVDIDKKNYALIQEGDLATSAISMRQSFNGHNHKDTIVRVLQKGLAVPRVSIFTTQLRNVNLALQGKGSLYDASGNLIKGDRLKSYSDTLNSNCWVWLLEAFEKGTGHLGLDVVIITGLEEQGKPIFKREPLERCLEDNCFAELESVNSQGFPTKKSPIQKYEPGKSVYFGHPMEDSAVRFGASPKHPDYASLSCGWLPHNSYAKLGVFPYAKGASQ